MATTVPPPPYLTSDLDHPQYHQALYELFAGSEAVRDVAAFTSSGAPLQAAHDDLPAAGGTLWFPPGFQLTPTAAISITKPCVIVGSVGSKLIQGGNSFFNLVNVGAVDRFGMTGMHLDGRLDVGRTADGDLLSLNGACADVRIIGNRFTNCHGGVAVGGGVDFANLRIQRNRVLNSQYAGCYFAGRIDKAWIEANEIDTTQSAGLLFDDLASGEQINVHILGNDIRNSQRQGGAGKAGIQTVASTGNRHRRFKIRGNTITNASRGGGGTGDVVGIGLDQITDSLIQHNHVLNPSFGEGIVVLGYGNNVAGNRVEGNGAGGVSFLSYGGEQQIADCSAVGNVIDGTSTAAGISVVANLAAGNNINGVLLSSNRCHGNNWGILTYNNGGTWNGSNIFVVANLLSGNVSGAASFVAGTNQTTDANFPVI